MEFSLEGMAALNTVAADLQRKAGQVGREGSVLLRRTALNVEATAKLFCPVDTGNLRNSISTDIAGDGRFASMSAEIGPTAAYGGYVEWGTSRMGPHAFVGPALDRHSGDFVAGVAALADPLP